jgi:uncharacterized SAM-binding protein YcdF (DUF218 family)
MADFLVQHGVDETDLLLEEGSKTTYENAVEVAKLLRQKDIEQVALVTDAAHLLRGVLCFETQGIRVVPIGALYGASEFAWELNSFLPSPAAADAVNRAFHEWLGLFWYWMHGRI